MRVTVVGLGPGAGRDLTGRAREALERGDPEAGAPLLDQAEGWLPATAYATPWEAAELARLRLRLALDRGLTPEDQRAWEASAAPAVSPRASLSSRVRTRPSSWVSRICR